MSEEGLEKVQNTADKLAKAFADAISKLTLVE